MKYKERKPKNKERFIQKLIKTTIAVASVITTLSLTSCDIMLDVLGGMAMGMASYNPYAYPYTYGVGTNNSYLLDPNYAIWQTQQQQAQMNQVQQQLIDVTIKQTERDMEELNRINQQLIETSIWQVEHGIILGGTEGTGETSGSTTSNPSMTTPTTTTKTHQCGLCGGSGEVIETNGLSFGNNKYCDKCKKTVPDYHYHTICPSCKGKGYW